MSLLAFQRALVALYAGKKPDTEELTESERRAFSGIDRRALTRYRRGLKLKGGR